MDDSQERYRQYTLFGVSPKTIKWLHRTARDYIEHPLKWNELVTLTAGTRFNPATSMLRSCVDLLELDRMEIDTEAQDDDSRRRFDDHVWFLSNAALIYAYHSNYQTRNPQCTILDRLSHLLSTPCRGGGDPYLQHNQYWQTYNSGMAGFMHNANIHGFLSLAVIYGLVPYVREKLRYQSSGRPIAASYASMLQYVPSIANNHQSCDYPPPCFEMVELFLQLGADPNARYDSGSSAWEKALHGVANLVHRFPGHEYGRDYLKIVSLLIKHGASPFAKIKGPSEEMPNQDLGLEQEISPRLTASQVLEAASSIFPEEAGNILQELRNHNPPRRENWRQR